MRHHYHRCRDRVNYPAPPPSPALPKSKSANVRGVPYFHENELFAAELASVGLIADRYAQLVNVYQAMGGGWVDIAGSIAPEPQGTVTVRAP